MNSTNNWPVPTPEALATFYGPVGGDQTRIELPFPVRLSWSPHVQINRMTCHRRVSDSMHRVLYTIHRMYGEQGIEELGLNVWGGCLNVRKKRGGKTWSLHAYGAACDWNPQLNALRTPWRQATFSRPEYIDFWNAWIYEGWEPLGLSWGRDAMHVQATQNNVKPISTHLYFVNGKVA